MIDAKQNDYEIGYDAARKMVAREALDLIDLYIDKVAVRKVKKLLAKHISEANKRIAARAKAIRGEL